MPTTSKQLGQEWTRLGNDVYQVSGGKLGSKISYEQFTSQYKPKGLNLEVIPQWQEQKTITTTPKVTPKTTTPKTTSAKVNPPATTPQTTTKKAVYQYAGSPDLFDPSTGRYLSESDVQGMGGFGAINIQKQAGTRPGIAKAEDFAKTSGTNITQQPQQQPVAPQTPQEAPQAPQQQGVATPPPTQAAPRLVRFQGSPDVFNTATGERVSEQALAQYGGFEAVEELPQLRPDIKTEEDFARLSGTNLSAQEVQSLSGVTPQPTAGAVPVTPGNPAPSTPDEDVMLDYDVYGTTLTEEQAHSLASIRSVFGQEWEPAPVFADTGLIQQGIFGAVRVAGDPTVYTVGPGGAQETAGSYSSRFGTEETAGIVGDVSVEQARRLGIKVKDDGTPLVTTTPDEAIKDPYNSFIDMYKQLYEQYGLSTVKERMSELDEELQSEGERYAEEVADINENPWIGEEQRLKSVSAEQTKHDSIKSSITDRVSLFKDMYENGQQEVRFLAENMLNQFNKDREFEQDKLEFWAQQAQKEAENTDVVAAGGRQLLIDATTGEIIADLGASEAALNRADGGGSGSGLGKILSPTEAMALGVPYGTTQAGAFGLTPQKPATAAQETVAGYAARLEQSNPTFKNLESTIAKWNPVNFAVQSKLPSPVQSNEMRQYQQAARNFINATLRRESGAVIADSEFDNAYSQYLPYPGDDAATLRQKENNRNIVKASFAKAAGPAYSSMDELLGGSGSALSELDEDISALSSQIGSRFNNREDILNELMRDYPELTESEIASRVYSLIPDR